MSVEYLNNFDVMALKRETIMNWDKSEEWDYG